MIRRKDSLGYVDFMRGKYPLFNQRYLLNIINEMTISAHRDFANAEIEANDNGQSQTMYLQTLSNIKDEYVKLVSSISPDLAVELDAKLATKANTYYTSYIDKKIKENATQTKVLAMGFVTQELNDLEKIFSSTIDNELKL